MTKSIVYVLLTSPCFNYCHLTA